MFTDKIDREIKVGDIIAYSSSNSISLRTAIVIKMNPKTISSNDGTHDAKNVLVITEQLLSSGRDDLVKQLTDEHKSRFDLSKPKAPSNAMKYKYMVTFGRGGSDTFAFIAKIESETENANSSNAHRFMKDLKQRFMTDGEYHRNFCVRPASRWSSEYKIDGSYGTYSSLLLRDIKALGLESYIGQQIPVDVFNDVVKDHKIRFDPAQIK